MKGDFKMIDNINDFVRTMFQIQSKTGTVGGTSFTGKLSISISNNGEIYCPTCCGSRRMDVSLFSTRFKGSEANFLPPAFSDDYASCVEQIKNILVPSLWIYKCSQCDTFFTVVFYQGANGREMAILPNCNGGVVSPNTPKAVAYYLDQAYKSKSVGANSACMSMYRASLEQLLYEQGYVDGMLNAKIVKLEKDIAEGTAKKWAKDLDTDFLKYIKELGNGCIHTNGGDIEKQKELDNELMELVDRVFSILLDMVYEQPKREDGWKNIFKDKTKAFEHKK